MNRVPSFCVKRPKTYEKNSMSEGLQNLIFGSGETLKTVDYFRKFKKKKTCDSYLICKKRNSANIFLNLTIPHFLLKKQNIH